MHRGVVLCALFLLIGLVVLVPTLLHGAGWICGADAAAAFWVTDIKPELLKEEYRSVLASDPQTSHVIAPRKLNQAAKPQQTRERLLTKELVCDAVGCSRTECASTTTRGAMWKPLRH